MYLRGLGLGIIVTTLIVSAGKSGRAAELSDEEIKRRLAQSLTRDHPERYCVITVDRSYVL